MMKHIKRVCIIDDDRIFQFMASKVIAQTNLVQEVIVFDNGLEAINFFKSVQNEPEKHPEIILLDLNMPVMNGWEFLEQYSLLQSGLGKEIPIYVVSSSIDPSDMDRAKANSAVREFVVKPITRQTIQQILESI